jgi:hypothetical protein
MHVFKKRNAVIGWWVTRIARKRMERRLNEAAGNLPSRSRLAVGAVAAVSVAAIVGALVSRHVVGTDA